MKKSKFKLLIALCATLICYCFSACNKDDGGENNGGDNVGGETNNYTIIVSANPDEGGSVSGGGTFRGGQSCTLTATAAEDYTFDHWTKDGSPISGGSSITFTVTQNAAYVAYFDYTGGSGYGYVDLGLPSGTLWATCNVGASSPEDYGDYFAWGETMTKSSYDWSNYKYCNGSSSTLTKYCNNSSYGSYGFTDNLTTLQSSDDAATANWGSGWCMPTKTQWEELNNNTTVTQTTQNGVKGRRFTGTNGNSIFLPAAGFRYGTNFSGVGSNGHYWSNSLNTDRQSYAWGPSCAWGLYFSFSSSNCSMRNSDLRNEGQSVRPVRSDSGSGGGETNNYTITVSASPDEGGTVSGGGTYEDGQSCTLTAIAAEDYTFDHWTKDDSPISGGSSITFIVTQNADYVACFNYLGGSGGNVPPGAIDGQFTINDNGDKVYFSQGNLQYKASTNTWRFATNQYDYIGDANSNISSSYSGWIDLFGWGTSGWKCGNTYYHPWDSSKSDGSLYGPPGNNNLTGSYANSDWGRYNAISNGGNSSGSWRTLTHEEWGYVFNSRSTSSGIRYAKAQVNNVNGVILLPDNWSSSYYTLYSTNSSGASFSSNIISSSTWTSSLQSHGAVFLPVAGYRYGTSVYGVGSDGDYWSASYDISYRAWHVLFIDGALGTDCASDRCCGRSVRLVCPVQ